MMQELEALDLPNVPAGGSSERTQSLPSIPSAIFDFSFASSSCSAPLSLPFIFLWGDGTVWPDPGLVSPPRLQSDGFPKGKSRHLGRNFRRGLPEESIQKRSPLCGDPTSPSTSSPSWGSWRKSTIRIFPVSRSGGGASEEAAAPAPDVGLRIPFPCRLEDSTMVRSLTSFTRVVE